MSITNVYLARHGETEYNRLNQIQGRGINASLNETGRLQAEAIAEYFESVKLDSIYSSSLNRSSETAGVVVERFGLSVQSYPELDEMDFGVLEGRPINEIKSELEMLRNNWRSGKVEFAMEEGESPQIVLDRAAGCAERLIREQQGTNLLFVLHGRLIRILLSHWLRFGLAGMHRIEHSNGALYHLQWDGQHFEPVYLHRTDHLSNSQSVT